MQSDGMDLDKAREFVKFVAQSLLIANTIEFDDDYYAVVDAIADASTLWELWEIIEDKQDMLMKISLDHYPINEELFLENYRMKILPETEEDRL